MFVVFNNIGLYQYAHIAASVHGQEIFKIGLHIFYRTEHRILPLLLSVSIISNKEHTQGALLIQSSIVLQS